MKQALTVEEFVQRPIGKWVVAGTTVAWCHSPTLCGGCCWGRPDGAAARAALRAYQAYKQLAPSFDVIIDGSAIEAVLPDAAFAMLEWMRTEMNELRRRVRAEYGVIPPGLDGLTLAGLAPQLGHPYPVRVVTDAREAFAALLPGDGDALADEVFSIVSSVRSISPAVLRLRALLRAHNARLPLAGAAHELGVSERQLQRELSLVGCSFRTELLDARFDCATRLLRLSDDKIDAVAAAVGVTTASLIALVRGKTGQTPMVYRAILRGTER